MSRTPFGPPTVLVVDDSDVILQLTKSTLEGAGLRVLTHSRPAGCVALILHERPDLVLIDVNMPQIAGDTVAKLFGKALPGSDIIVLLHSTLPADILQIKVEQSGAHGFIRKTNDFFEFTRQINQWLRRGGVSTAGLSSGRIPVALRVDPNDVEAPSGSQRLRTSAPSGNDGAPSSSHEATSGVTRVALPLVLLVDDDMQTLSSLRREVQSEPYTTEFALSGAQALRKIVSMRPPDAVVLDLLMPPPGGAELLRQILNVEGARQGRFVFLTEHGVAPDVMDLLRHFRGVVLNKPVDGRRLRTALREHLNDLSALETATGRAHR